MSPRHEDLDCDVAKAFATWLDIVSRQEEHSVSAGVIFHDTQELTGWTDHQECILPVMDRIADEVMEARTPAEAYILVKSAMCQVALICFILGRQHEGAEL